MALLRKLEYHEDTTEKRQITKEDIEFLKNLQKEMNTQDTVGQADPRFWVIRGTRREYGIECGYEDGYEITSDDNSYDIDEFIKLVEENGYINEIMEQEDEKYIIQKDEFECISIYDHNEDLIDEFELYDFISYLNDNAGTDFHLTNYRDMPCNYPDTFFLTNKAAQEALKTCSHHFSKDARTYAMTALYSPEVEKLWDILRRVDFSILETCGADMRGEEE